MREHKIRLLEVKVGEVWKPLSGWKWDAHRELDVQREAENFLHQNGETEYRIRDA